MAERRTTVPRGSRDIPPFGLRMPPAMKKRLEHEASLNGRSLNQELLERLQRTLDQQDLIEANGYPKVQEPGIPEFLARTDGEKALLAVFRRFPPEKQLALLSLFK